jgi:hypothetical protein
VSWFMGWFTKSPRLITALHDSGAKWGAYICCREQHLYNMGTGPIDRETTTLPCILVNISEANTSCIPFTKNVLILQCFQLLILLDMNAEERSVYRSQSLGTRLTFSTKMLVLRQQGIVLQPQHLHLSISAHRTKGTSTARRYSKHCLDAINSKSRQHESRYSPIILQIAIAADLLTNGRGKLLATQVMMIWYALTAPSGIKNMAKNLAPVFNVLTTIIFPTQLTISKQMIWILRSPVLPLVYVTPKLTRKVRNHTGAVSSKVAIFEYPSVLTMVGKKYWKVCVRREMCWNRMKM